MYFCKKFFMENNSSGSTRGWKFAVWVEGGIILILALLLFFQKQRTQTIVVEKQTTVQQNAALKAELDSLLAEHERIKQQYSEVSSKLSEKDSIIMSQAKEIEKLINSQADYYRIKKKLDALRKITQNYVHQIDSLYKANLALQEENKSLKGKVEEYSLKTDSLKKAKEELTNKITSASYLTAYNITATPYNVKGSSKMVKTTKARKVDMIRICFTLGENPLVEPGNLDIYIRVARPDNLILTQGSYSFIYQGKRIQYSAKTTVKYQQKAENVCVDFLRENLDLPPGKYHIGVFTSDRELGEIALNLN